MDAVDFDLKKSFISKQACFSQLTEAENIKLAELLKELHIKAGETIVTEGDHVDSVYLIVNGKADVRHVSVKDNALHTQSLATLNPGEAIGLNEEGFYSLSGLRTATVVAITDMLLLQLSLASFHGFALAYPHVAQLMRKNFENFNGQ